MLGHTADGEAVLLRHADRTAHVAMIGKSRFGKTTLLERLILDDFTSGTGVVLIDAQGDLTRRLVEIAPPEVVDRITVVDVNEQRPFGINLYECNTSVPGATSRTVSNVIRMFKTIFIDPAGRGFYPVIESGFRATAHTLIANNYTLTELTALYSDASFRRAALQRVTHQPTLGYWERYEHAPARDKFDFAEPVVNKVDALLDEQLLRYMFGQRVTTIPFDDALDNGSVLIFRLVGATLAEDTRRFLGMVFLAVLNNKIVTRSATLPGERRRVHLYLDEYGSFATPTTNEMLAQFGKFELGITVAFQNLPQVSGRLPSAASLVMFQVDGADADVNIHAG